MWYKTGFGILIIGSILAVVLRLEWWPVSHYPMYGGIRDFSHIAVYKWQVTLKDDKVIDVPFRRLPVLSSFSMSLVAMKESGRGIIEQETFITKYIDAELNILGLKKDVKAVAVFAYNFSKKIPGETCILNINTPDLCVQEKVIFKREKNN